MYKNIVDRDVYKTNVLDITKMERSKIYKFFTENHDKVIRIFKDKINNINNYRVEFRGVYVDLNLPTPKWLCEYMLYSNKKIKTGYNNVYLNLNEEEYREFKKYCKKADEVYLKLTDNI